MGGGSIRDRILEQTAVVLVQSGHRGLTMRAVAKATGISVGNLTYHFATHQALIEALVAHLLSEYVRSLDELLAVAPTRSAGQIRRLVEWHLRDAASPQTSALFRELWVLMAHHAGAACAVSAAYRHWMARLRAYFAECYPACPRDNLDKAVAIMATITEGTAVLFGPPVKGPMALQRFVGCAADVVCDCLSRQAATDTTTSSTSLPDSGKVPRLRQPNAPNPRRRCKANH